MSKNDRKCFFSCFYSLNLLEMRTESLAPNWYGLEWTLLAFFWFWLKFILILEYTRFVYLSRAVTEIHRHFYFLSCRVSKLIVNAWVSIEFKHQIVYLMLGSTFDINSKFDIWIYLFRFCKWILVIIKGITKTISFLALN